MVSLIVAMEEITGIIGVDGKIPWSIKGEQKQFKELTTGNVVIMGRKTYEEIGKPLPDRTNVVITSSNKQYEGCIVCHDLREALIKFANRKVFIIGGARLYEEALPYVEEAYVTIIRKGHVQNIKPDSIVTYFPSSKLKRFTIEPMKSESTDDYYRVKYVNHNVLRIANLNYFGYVSEIVDNQENYNNAIFVSKPDYKLEKAIIITRENMGISLLRAVYLEEDNIFLPAGRYRCCKNLVGVSYTDIDGIHTVQNFIKIANIDGKHIYINFDIIKNYIDIFRL